MNFGTIMYLTYRCNPDSASSGTSAFTACAVRITYKCIVCCRILSQPDTGGYCLRSCKNKKTKIAAAWGSEPSAVSGPSCWKPWAMTLSVGMFCESCATNYVEPFADPQWAAGTQQYHPMLWIFHPKERRQGILREIRESFWFCFQFRRWIYWTWTCFVAYVSTMCFPKMCFHEILWGPLQTFPCSGGGTVKVLLELCHGHLLDFQDSKGGKLSPKEMIEPFVQITEAVPRRKNRSNFGSGVLFFCGGLNLAGIQKHLRGCTFRCKFEQQVQRYPFRGCGWCCWSCCRKKKDPNSIRGLHSRDLPAHSSMFVKHWKKQRNDTHRVSHIFSHSGPSFEPVTTTANSHAKRHCNFAISCCLWPQTVSFRWGICMRKSRIAQWWEFHSLSEVSAPPNASSWGHPSSIVTWKWKTFSRRLDLVGRSILQPWAKGRMLGWYVGFQ